MIDNKIHVHFMGICGSGCASVAMMAHDAGYEVSGCDISTSSYYAEELKKKNIRIFTGHDAVHITDDVDVVAVSPALFDIDPDNAELKLAQKRGILMTWEAFTGDYLQKDMRTIAVSGTHGKTTTTFLTAEILIHAGLDPNVIGGSIYKKWNSGGRSGNSDLFLIEADEFNRNFHHYKPEIAVLNNVEMDHPECYADFPELVESFCHFVRESGPLKTLILNGDSEGAVRVLQGCSDSLKERKVRVRIFTKNVGLSLPGLSISWEKVVYRSVKKDRNGTAFVMITGDGREHHFSMRLFGEYNVSNAASAFLISDTLGISDSKIQESLMDFEGVGRRFDQVGLLHNVPVYDDYAHHPTEIASLMTMVKEYFPEEKLLAIFEPHQVSRLTLMFDRYASALNIADHVVIAKTHLGREVHRGVTPIEKERWEAVADKFICEEDNEKIRDLAERMVSQNQAGIIVVIGAANSYKISRLLCES